MEGETSKVVGEVSGLPGSPLPEVNEHRIQMIRTNPRQMMDRRTRRCVTAVRIKTRKKRKNEKRKKRKNKNRKKRKTKKRKKRKNEKRKKERTRRKRKERTRREGKERTRREGKKGMGREGKERMEQERKDKAGTSTPTESALTVLKMCNNCLAMIASTWERINTMGGHVQILW